MLGSTIRKELVKGSSDVFHKCNIVKSLGHLLCYNILIASSLFNARSLFAQDRLVTLDAFLGVALELKGKERLKLLLEHNLFC